MQSVYQIMNQVFYIKFLDGNLVLVWHLEHNSNIDNKFSSEILNLYLNFIKFKVDLHIQVVPNLFFNNSSSIAFLI